MGITLIKEQDLDMEMCLWSLFLPYRTKSKPLLSSLKIDGAGIISSVTSKSMVLASTQKCSRFYTQHL